jgi:hypothetical protein
MVRDRRDTRSQVPWDGNSGQSDLRESPRQAAIAAQSVLYVHPMDDYLGIGSPRTNVTRYRALASLPGMRVQSFDGRTAWGKSQWEKRVNRRLYMARPVRDINTALIEAVREAKPDYVVVDGEAWLYPATLKQIKQHAGALIYYATDDAMARPTHLWLHRLGARYYDLYLTTNRFNVREIRDRYGVPSFRVGMGYDRDYHSKAAAGAATAGTTGSSLIFIGHWEPHTEGYVNALIEAGYPLSLYGARWQKAKNPALRRTQPLPGKDYVAAIRDASIALCFLSRENRNESTGRSYEITGIGTFMLAERTDEHEFLFGDGAGAGLFSSRDELVEKAGYYLRHPSERELMAQAGNLRCMKMGLSWQEHIQREWPMAMRVLEQGIDTLTGADDLPFWAGFRRGELPKQG